MKYEKQEIEDIYNLPFTTLIYRAQETHHRHQDPSGGQTCALKSIKTGSCPEDCKYCPQSAHHATFVEPEKLLDTATILKDARRVAREGASRFCMGAAWKQVPDGPQFESVLETTSAVKALGLEVCCTLGSMTKGQAVLTIYFSTATCGLCALLLPRVAGFLEAGIIVLLVVCVLALVAILETAARRKIRS